MRMTLIGGPSFLLEYGGRNWIVDPTFDAEGTEYALGPLTLRKVQSPGLRIEDLPALDYALVSHDQHPDNLDAAGREVLKRAGTVLTTEEGAERLGGGARGLAAWSVFEKDGIRITGTPARHGPPGFEAISGPVTGFLLEAPGEPAVYISGDTVWYEGLEEVARRFQPEVAILFLGAARVRAIGPDHVTMTAEEGVLAARAFAKAEILPVHVDSWAHFEESRSDVEGAFARAGLSSRLLWPELGRPVSPGSRR